MPSFVSVRGEGNRDGSCHAEANGPAFVRQLREFYPSLPVVVISGMCEAEQEYSGLNVTFLRKPCPPHNLIREVRAHLLHFA